MKAVLLVILSLCVFELLGQPTVACTSNTDCLNFDNNGNNDGICDLTVPVGGQGLCRRERRTTADGVHRTCFNNNDCDNGDVYFVVCGVEAGTDGVCVSCTSNNDCDNINYNGFICDFTPKTPPMRTRCFRANNIIANYNYRACLDDNDCDFEESRPSCVTDFRTPSTTVCGCNQDSHCRTDWEGKSCDLTANLPGFCKDPKFASADGLHNLCVNDRDCDAALPVCSQVSVFTGLPTNVCTGCTTDAECTARWPGTVCYVNNFGGFTAGTCAPPACNSNTDCLTEQLAQCSNPTEYNAQCVTCGGENDCVLFPETPYCAPNGRCSVGCYTDGHCADGWHCLEHVCVECITSYHCFQKNQDMPVCDTNVTHTCNMCTEDADCLGQVSLFEACHTEFVTLNDSDVETQVIGRCVIDTYNKGLQISALILGSLATFFVIIAILIGVAAFTK